MIKHFESMPEFEVDTCMEGKPTYKGSTLSDVYGSYSSAKVRAYERCCELCSKYDGENFYISSSNCNRFTIAFRFNKPDTGELMQALITDTHNWAWFV